jgi:hypothetical protein
VHLATLLPRGQGYSRALPLRWVPVFPPKAVPGAATSRKDWEAALAELCRLRAELDAVGRAAQDVLGLVNGSFGGCPAGRSPTA